MTLYERLETELNEIKDAKRYNYIKELESPQGPYIKVNGQEYLNMCSNNYLGWANDPININAAKQALDMYGVGPGAVRSIAGTYKVHREFEQALADFKGVEATIVLQSGFQANTALLASIGTDKDIFLSDELNHASIIDGMRLSKSLKKVYKHCDVVDLEEKLKQVNVEGNIYVVSDGVFSMDGDIAPLDKIYEV